MKNPAERARELARSAADLYQRKDLLGAKQMLKEADALMPEVERYAGRDWLENHNGFTETMLDMADLWLKLGNAEEARALARRAQAWADDPNTGGHQGHFERSLRLQEVLLAA